MLLLGLNGMWKWQWDCCSSLCSTFKKRSEVETLDTFNRFQSLTARLDFFYVFHFHPVTESLHSSWDRMGQASISYSV